jgi:uncharacterized protein YjbI with pentapeptide repeats
MSRYDRCSYIHDVSDGSTFSDFDDDEWRCPHSSCEGTDLCIFHSPPDELDLSDKEVARRFSWVINGEARDEKNVTEGDRERYLSTDLTTEERKQFIGAEFGDLRPPVMELVTAEEFRSHQEETPLDLRESAVRGEMDFSRVDIFHSVYADMSKVSKIQFEGVDIGGSARFFSATIKNGVQFSEATIEDKVSLVEASIENTSWFIEATIEGNAEFRGATIEGGAEFRGATIEGEAKFSEATIEGGADFRETTIGTNLWFGGATIEMFVGFRQATIRNVAEFGEATIEGHAGFGEATIGGDARFNEATIGGGARFNETTIGGTAWFNETTIEDNAKFRKVSVQSAVRFKEANIECDAEFNKASIEGVVDFEEASIEGVADFEEASIEKANFGEVTVENNLNFGAVTIGSTVSFKNANIKGGARFNKSTIKGKLIIANMKVGLGIFLHQCKIESISIAPVLTHSAWSIVDMSGSHIKKGTLAQPEHSRVFYDLTNATIGDVELKGGEDPAYQYARFQYTEFNDFDFDDAAEELSAVDWKLYTLTDGKDGTTHRRSGWAAVAMASEFADAGSTARELRDTLCDTPDVAKRLDNNEPSVQILTDELDDFRDTIPINDDNVRDAITSLASHIATLETEEYELIKEEQNIAERVPPEERESINTEPLTTALAEAMSDEAAVRPSPSEKEATQRNAKIAAREAGVEPYAANFYIWEMRNRRSKYAAEALHPDTDDSTVDRLQAAYKWLGNKLLDLTTVYGERTNRVVLVSLGWVGLFAVVYRLLAAPAPTGSGWGDYLLFSFQSFIAFILGGAPQTSSFSIQFASAIEGFTGGFFVALFVFALTRSVQR